MLKRIASLLLFSLLAACGGGGGETGTSVFGSGGGTAIGTGTATGGSSGTIAAATLSIALSSSTVTAAAPATVTATLVDASGNAVANQVVSFASAKNFGTFSSVSALTNASGAASVVLYPSATTTVGADTVTATATVNAVALTSSIGFQLTATNITISGLTSDVGTGTLAAYGQTTLTVTTAGAVAGSAVSVTLSSTCLVAGKASLSATSASTTTGTVTFAYQDKGCGATFPADTLQATVTGSAASTALSLRIASPAASSLTFVSASPETIYLRGTGLTQTSTVTFQVVDIAGSPLPNQPVTMVATTYTGGLTLDGVATPVTKTSDAAGKVTVIVNSGTVPTPVRVKASLGNNAITTSSSNLTITVGLPSQINFSLSQTTRNIEGGTLDGTPNSYNIIASDRMGNPVPAGTTVNFVSSGSQIVGSGQIALDANGNARTSVTLISSDPRPADGRITIVAYALGEESFNDANGDNVYQLGEDYQELGDVFISNSFSSTFDPVNDQRIAYTLSTPAGTCHNATAPRLQLDASVPSLATFNGAPRCDGQWGQAYVRRAIQTVLSTSSARPLWPGKPFVVNGVCSPISLKNDTGTALYYLLDGTAQYALGAVASGAFSILVADENPVRLNPMAAGSTLSVSATTGLTATVLSGSPVPSSLQATGANISYSFASGTISGVITINLRSPSGLITSYSLNVVQASGTQCP